MTSIRIENPSGWDDVEIAHYRTALEEFLTTTAAFGAPVSVNDPVVDSQMKILSEIMRRIMALEERMTP